MPPFTEVAATVAVFALIALFAIPRFRRIYADTGHDLPVFTRFLFRVGPFNLIVLAFILGVVASLGRLRPDLRWLSRGSALVIFVLGVSIVLGLIAPIFSLPPP